MRFYCLEDNKDFYMPFKWGARVVCDVGPHDLGRRFPDEPFWEHCSQCEATWVAGPQSYPSRAHCPGCYRKVELGYLCHVCETFGLKEAGNTGEADPIVNEDICGACSTVLQDLRWHYCLSLSKSFLSERDECPLCNAGFFPTAASELLSGISGQSTLSRINELEVEYLSLMPAMMEDADEAHFFVISRDRTAIVVPRYATRSMIQKRARKYQRVFDWPGEWSGDLVIERPAIFELAGDCWKLKRHGKLNGELTTRKYQESQLEPEISGHPVSGVDQNGMAFHKIQVDQIVPSPSNFEASPPVRTSKLATKPTGAPQKPAPGSQSSRETTPDHSSTESPLTRSKSSDVTRENELMSVMAAGEDRRNVAEGPVGSLTAEPSETPSGQEFRRTTKSVSTYSSSVDKVFDVTATPAQNEDIQPEPQPTQEAVPEAQTLPPLTISRDSHKQAKTIFGTVVVITLGLALLGLMAWGLLGPNGSPPGKGDPMLRVEAGTFLMGRSDGEENERPQHTVTVGPFWIDQYEVTREAYEKFVKATNHRFPSDWSNGHFPMNTGRWPATGLDWYAADAYCRWVGKRLPTEEEWEIAARGTDGRKYPWGNEWQAGFGNAENAASGLTDVNQFNGASPYGAIGMVGNAWEWTSSKLAPYPGGQIPANETGNGQVDLRVIRGGSWQSKRTSATTTYRWGWPASGGSDYGNTGFRCVKDP